ncbi:hypothetical protein D3C78_1580700 [compost metagenome]
MQGRRPLPRRRRANLLKGDLALRRRQRHGLVARREGLQQGVETAVSQLGAAPLFPYGDQLIDRTQHTAHQDRTGNHHSGGHVTLDHQQCAKAQHQRLQAQAQGFAQGTDDGARVAGLVLQAEEP